MRQITTPAIILRRTNYGEADRIVTFLTPTGKLRAIVKGVRRSKSKLAGGIELFSESTVTFIEGKSDLATIISTRLNVHWDGIVGDLQRMMFGYEAMKLIDKVIEDDAERDYYEILRMTLEGLADSTTPLAAVELWFYVRILRLLGHGVNLKTDQDGRNLVDNTLYTFSVENMCFSPNNSGQYRSDHIKLLRLSLSQPVTVLKQVKQVGELSKALQPLFKQLTIQQT